MLINVYCVLMSNERDIELIKLKADEIVENMHRLHQVNRKLSELQAVKTKLQVELADTVGQWEIGQGSKA